MPRGVYKRKKKPHVFEITAGRKPPKKLSAAEARKLKAAATWTPTDAADAKPIERTFQPAETPWSQYIIILVTAEGKRTVDLTSNRLSLEETLQQVRVQNPSAEQWSVIRYNEMDFAQSVHRGR